MRSMVEGYVQSSAAHDLLYPTTTLRPRGKQRAPRVPLSRSLPLPLRGRIAFSPLIEHRPAGGISEMFERDRADERGAGFV